jgi:predicted alpha-1,2-mannosidase
MKRLSSLARILAIGLISSLLNFLEAAENHAHDQVELPADGQPVTPADYVNVFTGNNGARWMFAPGPWMPMSMVKLAPDNKIQGYRSGYDDSLGFINCFSHIHEWTMAGLGMMPTVGPLRTHAGVGDDTSYGSHFDPATEHGGIGFYNVLLKDSGIKVELTATTRASLQRYTFPASDEARVLYPFMIPNEYEMHILSATVRRIGNNEIEGTVQTDLPKLGYVGDQRFDLHFVSQFSQPFEALGGWQNIPGKDVTIQVKAYRPAAELANWSGGEVQNDVPLLQMSGDSGAFVKFKTTAGEQVEVRTGMSLVSVEDARLNLEQELAQPFGWDFDAVVQNQRSVWNEIFNRIEIETPDPREKTRFYTGFYRGLSGRNIWSDVNGKWIDPFGRPQQLTDPHAVMLGSDALWTTFWSLNQLMNLIAPEWSVQWTNSELQLYDKCGWLAKGPAGLKYIPVMVAEHEIPLMVAAYQHGLKVDGEKILAASIKMQTSPPQKNLPDGGAVGNADLENYLKYGYVAANGPNGPGGGYGWDKPYSSNTYEYAYDDWCVAQLALTLGHPDVAQPFLKRSQSWQSQFDPSVGYARPRNTDGSWVSPFDPYKTPGFAESDAWQYTWFVPHDPAGLVQAMGRDRFIQELNDGFVKSAPGRYNGGGRSAVYHGNEPSMHMAWLFNWANAPALTQQWVRSVLERYYGYTPSDFYLGDDDQGQMSSWFVMASIGLFEMDGGCRPHPIYEIAAPLYTKVTLHLSPHYYGGTTFVIEAPQASAENCYIQSATLNGQPLNQWWIPWQEVVKGGRLVLDVGSKPNEQWAKDCPLPELGQ